MLNVIWYKKLNLLNLQHFVFDIDTSSLHVHPYWLIMALCLSLLTGLSAVSGLGGAAYVWVHRQYVLFMRRNKKMTAFLQKK
jgi:hypothetical protein